MGVNIGIALCDAENQVSLAEEAMESAVKIEKAAMLAIRKAQEVMGEARSVLEESKRQLSLVRCNEAVAEAEAIGCDLISRSDLRDAINATVKSTRIGADSDTVDPCPKATWGDAVIAELEWTQSRCGFHHMSLKHVTLTVDGNRSALFQTVTMTMAQQDRVWELLKRTCLRHSRNDRGWLTLSPPYRVISDESGRTVSAAE